MISTNADSEKTWRRALRRHLVTLSPCHLVILVFLLPACSQDMARQPAYKPLTASDFFADGRSARPIVAGTVARGQLHVDSALSTGRDDKGELVTEFPFAMTREVLERGKQRYTIFCSACHGLTGEGDGRIVKRGFTAPPNYHTDLSRGLQRIGQQKKLTEVPVGYFFEVITKGYGAMAEYATQIPINDRWAVAGYVRTLQYSFSPELRKQMNAGGEKGGKK
jgi:mono/diheme cytochrome c family protein